MDGPKGFKVPMKYCTTQAQWVSTEQREKQTKFKEISVQDFCSYNFDLVLDKRDLTEK